MREATADRLKILAAAGLFSTGGAAIKATSLTGWQVAGFRSAVAAAVLLALLPGAWNGLSLRAALIGSGYATTLILFVLANKLTTAANTIFLQSTYPLYLVVLGPLLLREPNRRRDFLFLAVVAVGMGLFFAGTEAATRTAPDPARGNVLAALSGFCWALTIAGLRHTGRDGTPGRDEQAASVLLGNLFAFVWCLPMALPVEEGESVDWLAIGYLGTFQIGFAYALLTSGIQRVRAVEAGLILLAEPVLNPLWAWFAHGERPSALSLAGGAIILGASAARAALR
jgi:drug/metabolite transporter (DMT)-like permease